MSDGSHDYDHFPIHCASFCLFPWKRDFGFSVTASQPPSHLIYFPFSLFSCCVSLLDVHYSKCFILELTTQQWICFCWVEWWQWGGAALLIMDSSITCMICWATRTLRIVTVKALPLYMHLVHMLGETRSLFADSSPQQLIMFTLLLSVWSTAAQRGVDPPQSVFRLNNEDSWERTVWKL